MAVAQLTAYLYTGLSGDSKPLTGVITGAVFIETDTGAEYTWDSASWLQVTRLVRLDDVTLAGGEITATPPKSTTASTPSIAADATALAANSSRKAWIIQNLGTDTLYVRLGSGATTSVFTVALRPGDANDDGKGDVLSDVIWQGAVTVAGTSPRYTATEFT